MNDDRLFKTLASDDWCRASPSKTVKRIATVTAVGGALLIAGCSSSSNRASQEVADVVAASRATTSGDAKVIGVQKEARKDERVREAFDLGQLQATKALHQAIQNTQNTDAAGANADDRTLVPLTVPERKIDGVIVNPGVEYVRLPR